MSRDTRPELALRCELRWRGLRFRVNYREVPGKPDITLTRARTAVFVDERFWHRCPIHCRIPRNNRDWWRVKPDRNVTRDREKDAALTALGWLPVHYWGGTMTSMRSRTRSRGCGGSCGGSSRDTVVPDPRIHTRHVPASGVDTHPRTYVV